MTKSRIYRMEKQRILSFRLFCSKIGHPPREIQKSQFTEEMKIVRNDRFSGLGAAEAATKNLFTTEGAYTL